MRLWVVGMRMGWYNRYWRVISMWMGRKNWRVMRVWRQDWSSWMMRMDDWSWRMMRDDRHWRVRWPRQDLESVFVRWWWWWDGWVDRCMVTWVIDRRWVVDWRVGNGVIDRWRWQRVL